MSADVERLLAFGRALLEGSLDGADRTAAVIGAAVAADAATFWGAVTAQASARTDAYLAALDDPSTPAGDLEAARTDLEALVAACAALGEPLDEALHRRVTDRDAELEARLG